MLQNGAAIKGPMNLIIRLDKSPGPVDALMLSLRKKRRHERTLKLMKLPCVELGVAKKNASGCSAGNCIFDCHVSRNNSALDFGSVIHTPEDVRKAGIYFILILPHHNSRVELHQRRSLQLRFEIEEQNLREYAA